MTLSEKLHFIRDCLDKDTTGCDIETVVEKGKELSQLIGLSAECKVEARKFLDRARKDAILELSKLGYGPSIVLKMADGVCSDYTGLFEYADRLNAGITHQLDFYRSVISLHKTELETSLKQ